jgi:sugar phosphate isomerase/epimerase
MKLGASIWPFQWDPPYGDAIRRIAGLGFKSVELVAWNKALLDEYYTPARVRELRRLLDGEGLTVAQFVHTPKGLASPDAAVRRDAVASFRQAVEVGAALGTPIMNSLGSLPFDIVIPRIVERPFVQTFRSPYPRNLDWPGNWDQFVDATRECASAAADAGMKYTIEATLFRWISDTASMLRLIEHTGSPNLGMNFDPSHLFPSGCIPHVVVYQLRDRIFNCHFSDNDGVTNTHWRPGKGKIDWLATMNALADIGYRGGISIELEDVPGVARATWHAQANPTATDEFATETVAGIQYIRRVAKVAGLETEWGGNAGDETFYP